MIFVGDDFVQPLCCAFVLVFVLIFGPCPVILPCIFEQGSKSSWNADKPYNFTN